MRVLTIVNINHQLFYVNLSSSPVKRWRYQGIQINIERRSQSTNRADCSVALSCFDPADLGYHHISKVGKLEL